MLQLAWKRHLSKVRSFISNHNQSGYLHIQSRNLTSIYHVVIDEFDPLGYVMMIPDPLKLSSELFVTSFDLGTIVSNKPTALEFGLV